MDRKDLPAGDEVIDDTENAREPRIQVFRTLMMIVGVIMAFLTK
jgi:hypothetical protein